MNREIKFRVWDSQTQKYLRVWDSQAQQYLNTDSYYFSVDFKEFIAFDRYFNSEDEKIVVQQYTGIKDVNGLEIYEGDIVECDDYMDSRISGEVIYDNEYGAFRVVFSDILQRTFYRVVNPVVVGNANEKSN